MEYEKVMMKREIETMFPHALPLLDQREPIITNLKEEDLNRLYWLTFIIEYKIGEEWHETYQCRVERDDTLKVAKQHTRYSTHGIHEYKGKFNPQIVHCMINLFGINKDSRVLDPFNGSGTTILECAHLGIHAEGTDINPMACFIANAKISALKIDVKRAKECTDVFFKNYQQQEVSKRDYSDLRLEYLKKWIPEENLDILEDIREFAERQEEGLQSLLLTLTSDLIRDYSYQEPFDLRIRRRKTPMPETPLMQVLKENLDKHFRKIEEIQLCLGSIKTENKAINCDIKVGEIEELVVTSGNFTGPGMSQNGEAAIRVDGEHIKAMNFSWEKFTDSILDQQWDIYQMDRSDIEAKNNPAWALLYDEVHGSTKLEDSQLMTMVITLSHSDTARIQAEPGSKAGLGTQYFWLSKGTFDFFPALTEKNKRGIKNTYSCNVNMTYVDLDVTQPSRVTFEADNNLDFRLGTGALRYSKIADENDLALISRLSEYDYQLRIIKKGTPQYKRLAMYATSFIGGQGKKFGYISNADCFDILEEETS
jgi:hypothetical protein